MAEFELSIYGKDDEVEKKYETNYIRTGIMSEALRINEISDPVKQFPEIYKLMKKAFIGLTDEEIDKTDFLQLKSTFQQFVRKAKKFELDNSKNV